MRLTAFALGLTIATLGGAAAAQNLLDPPPPGEKVIYFFHGVENQTSSPEIATSVQCTTFATKATTTIRLEVFDHAGTLVDSQVISTSPGHTVTWVTQTIAVLTGVSLFAPDIASGSARLIDVKNLRKIICSASRWTQPASAAATAEPLRMHRVTGNERVRID